MNWRENKNIPIVVAADHNLEKQLIVLIGSMLFSANADTKYTIIVFADNLLNVNRIYEMQKIYKNVDLHIYQVKDDLLKEAHVNGMGLTAFTYIRLFIPQMLREYDKCLYLDIDMVINQDLSELLMVNVEDYYVAGVKDYIVQKGYSMDRKYLKTLNQDSLEKYINAGVLLMNLKKIRQDEVDKQFKECIGRKWKHNDQDIINRCCAERMLILPLKYNVFYKFYKRIEMMESSFYQQEQMEEAQSGAAIVHYVGAKAKPWKLTRSRAARLWWEVAEKVLTREEYEDIRKSASEFEKQMEWGNFIEKCKNRKVIIWGFSEIGKNLCQALQNCKIEIVCFIDSDIKKIGMKYLGIEVKSFEDILREYKKEEVFFAISSQLYYLDIERKLLENGFSGMVRYINKGEAYYMALDEVFYEEEVREIECKERRKRCDFDQQIYDKYAFGCWENAQCSWENAQCSW